MPDVGLAVNQLAFEDRLQPIAFASVEMVNDLLAGFGPPTGAVKLKLVGLTEITGGTTFKLTETLSGKLHPSTRISTLPE